MCIYVNVYIYICLHVYVYTYMNMYIYIYMYIYMYVCIYSLSHTAPASRPKSSKLCQREEKCSSHIPILLHTTAMAEAESAPNMWKDTRAYEERRIHVKRPTKENAVKEKTSAEDSYPFSCTTQRWLRGRKRAKRVKRDVCMWKETYVNETRRLYVKRDVCIWKKTCVWKGTYKRLKLTLSHSLSHLSAGRQDEIEPNTSKEMY